MELFSFHILVKSALWFVCNKLTLAKSSLSLEPYRTVIDRVSFYLSFSKVFIWKLAESSSLLSNFKRCSSSGASGPHIHNRIPKISWTIWQRNKLYSVEWPNNEYEQLVEAVAKHWVLL